MVKLLVFLRQINPKRKCAWDRKETKQTKNKKQN